MGSPGRTVECPFCRHSNPPGTLDCVSCRSRIPSEDFTQLDAAAGDDSLLTPAAAHVTSGTVIADRYEILRLLGQGGMGAVYQAKDRELDRLIALKIIRPDLARDSRVLQRFKQELILARQVTHRNVVRIFDLGVTPEFKFITMEFVEGRDLAAVLTERRLPLAESLHIVRQVCRALEAAHGEGVIHRDLKTSNIMVGDRNRVRVMDFGLARSTELSGFTQVGAMLGTPAYMSPEQAQGRPADARSDLYSLGIIFYELLTGKVPFHAESVWAMLLQRTQAPPPDPVTLNPDIPPAVSRIVLKCLAVDPAGRYPDAAAMLRDLDQVAGDSVASAPSSAALPVPPAPAPPRSRGRWMAASLALLAVLGAGFLAARWYFTPHPVKPPAPVTLLVADFVNRTGQPVFDGTLEPMFNFALEGAGFITSYDRGQAKALAAQLEHRTVALDLSAARVVAANQGLDIVVTGALERDGSRYRLSVRAMRPITGEVVGNARMNASGKEDVLLAAPKLAARIRQALGDTASEADQLFAMETLAASSVDAVHQYAVALDALYATQYERARAAFSAAVQLDPKFGLSYAGLAVIARNEGRQAEAERYIKLAIANIDHMTERERYRTRGFYYLLVGDQNKCVEEYGALLNRYPSDARALNQLALCDTGLRRIPEARRQMERAVAILPKLALLRNNLALYEAYGSDFAAAERDARAAQQLNPAYAKAYVALAFAQIGQGQLSRAADTYGKLQSLGTLGASDAASGLADLALYQGRFSDAAAILEKGAAEDLRNQSPDRAAAKFAALAYTQLSRGQAAGAAAAAETALEHSRASKIRFLAARVLAGAGKLAKARELAAGLASELLIEPRAEAKLIEGEAALEEHQPRSAIQLFTDANQLLDTWLGRFGLGRAYLEAGAFTEADSEFDRAIRRRGEALALFLDEVPTYGYFPPVYYYRGRVHEALKTADFADSYRTYLDIRGKAGQDPLLPELRRR